jgi:hypothetical protein
MTVVFFRQVTRKSRTQSHKVSAQRVDSPWSLNQASLAVSLLPLALPSNNNTTPTTMATSARLNTPVRKEPTPSLTKSMTAPSLNMRSIRFPTPPPAKRDSPTHCSTSKLRALTVNASVSSKLALVKMTNSKKRASRGNFDPKPRKAPGFSVYSNRTESFNNETEEEANDPLAIFFVA